MKKLAPKILVSCWGVWFVYLIARLFIERHWGSSQLIADHGTPYAMSFDCPLVVAITSTVAWRLHQRPRNTTAIAFLVFCAILIWKFWIGSIVMWMHPSMGGHTLNQAFSQWWSHGTTNTRLTLATLLPPVLVLFSVFYWPNHCRQKSMENGGQA